VPGIQNVSDRYKERPNEFFDIAAIMVGG
jgi:hypothetical protein